MRWLALVALLASPAAAVECRDLSFDGKSYTACEVDPRSEDLRLFRTGTDDQVLGSFSAVDAALAPRQLSFGMNAGMYHPDRSPVGYYVENGQEQMRIVANAGPGNFGLLPNGIFCIEADRARVIETRAFQTDPPACRHATQSGPMLVINGALHPRFIPGGSSEYLRNGVGTSADGSRAVFVISNEPVNFDSFGRLFRDELKLPNALFLDGKISRLHAPQIGRSDFGFFAMGPIVGVVTP